MNRTCRSSLAGGTRSNLLISIQFAEINRIASYLAMTIIQNIIIQNIIIMKLTFNRIIIGVIFTLIILGLLRYRPWNNDTTTNSRDVIHKGSNKSALRELTVGYLPVTCHLTCPVTDFASKTTNSNTNFNSRVFSDFPTVVSALEAKQVQATFMIVPLAMKLREQGVPVKICYLGHRDGSEIVVGKNSKIRSLVDLKGKKVAIPSLYSNQNFVIHKLMEDYGMKPDDITFVVLPPPDMPTSLAAGAIDGYFVGEPFCAKAELDGTGRILYYARDKGTFGRCAGFGTGYCTVRCMGRNAQGRSSKISFTLLPAG